MLISPFTPLFFLTPRKSFEGECPFMQFFSVDDCIYIQVIRASDEESCACVVTKEGYSAAQHVFATSSQIGNSSYVDTYSLNINIEGIYTVSIGGHESEPFEVTSDQTKLERSVLIEYSPADNTTRCDVVPIIDDERQYFAFRVPGGFKPSGYDFSVDNEQFISQRADIVELYARESTQETLTIGWSRGVPVWFGQMINRLLTCRYVYIDSFRYARFESSVPEMTQTIEGMNSFVFTQKLQRINYLEPQKA